jgi:WD40 repeat protein
LDQELASFTTDDEAKLVAFNKEGTLLAVASKSGTVYLLNVPGLSQSSKLTGLTVPVSALAFSPDSKAIALGAGKTVYLRDIQTGEARGEFSHDDTIGAVGFSPDGSQLLVASAIGGGDQFEPKSYARWNIVSKQQELQFSLGSSVNAAVFSPDGKYIAFGGGESLVRVREVESGREIA